MISENKTLKTLGIQIKKESISDPSFLIKSFMTNRTITYLDLNTEEQYMDQLQIQLFVMVMANRFIEENFQ